MILDEARAKITAAIRELVRSGNGHPKVVALLREAESIIARHYRFAPEIGYRYEIGAG